MPKKLRLDPHPIPPHASGRAKGTAFDIKSFPDSRSGAGTGPFTDPPIKPPALPNNPTDAQVQAHFQGWVDFFVNLVGAKLEMLNGLQFDLDKGAPAKLNRMRDELALLADGLGMNLAGTVSVPPDLFWPLGTAYTITWDPREADKIDFDSLTLDLYFEDEPDQRMVVNSSVALEVTCRGNT